MTLMQEAEIKINTYEDLNEYDLSVMQSVQSHIQKCWLYKGKVVHVELIRIVTRHKIWMHPD